jgi:phage-related tail protein
MHGQGSTTWMRRQVVALLIGCAAALAGCDSLYYKAMKKVGFEKRDILVKRVKEARESQVKAQEDFKTALERLKEIVDVQGGELEETYNRLNKELERSEDRARDVHDRVNAVRDVSKDLFKEWQNELGKYSDRTLRAESERELRDTRRRTEALVARMEQVEKKIDPVLKPLRDRVLFLKHNLNARALGALTRELAAVSRDVDALIVDMQQAIGEADAYLKAMTQGEAHTS